MLLLKQGTATETRAPLGPTDGVMRIRLAMGLIKVECHDAFISYASRDDAAHGNLIKGIRDDLRKKFEARFSTVCNTEADFFIDQGGMPANGLPSEELKKEVVRSEFLFILMSEYYLASDFCGKELDWFSDRWGGSREQTFTRTFVIVLEKKAKFQSWRTFLERPERPKFVEFFDEDGNPIKRFLQAEDYKAVLSPAYEAKLDWIAKTMIERAREREVMREIKALTEDETLLHHRLDKLKKIQKEFSPSTVLEIEKEIANRYIFGER